MDLVFSIDVHQSEPQAIFFIVRDNFNMLYLILIFVFLSRAVNCMKIFLDGELEIAAGTQGIKQEIRQMLIM